MENNDFQNIDENFKELPIECWNFKYSTFKKVKNILEKSHKLGLLSSLYFDESKDTFIFEVQQDQSIFDFYINLFDVLYEFDRERLDKLEIKSVLDFENNGLIKPHMQASLWFYLAEIQYEISPTVLRSRFLKSMEIKNDEKAF